MDRQADTAVPLSELKRLGERITTIPSNFKLHPLVEKVLADRRAMAEGKLPLDWGMAEHLAFATLLSSGYPVRITGQDTARGTFSHRHAVLHDQNREKFDEGTYTPLENVSEGRRLLRSSTRCCRKKRCWASSTATRARSRTRWWYGKRSSAISSTAHKSSSISSCRRAK